MRFKIISFSVRTFFPCSPSIQTMTVVCIIYYLKKISWGREGGYSRELNRPVLELLALFQTKKVIFHDFFQSWPLSRNYIKEFANISFSFLFFNLELKRQIRAYTAFFSFENHSQFQTKMSKVYIRFQTEKAQKPYPLGWHMPMWLTVYIREYM